MNTNPNSDVFHDGVNQRCDCCNSDDRELRSFGWGRVQITACEICFNDIRKRMTYGLKKQHAFHESQWLEQKRT